MAKIPIRPIIKFTKEQGPKAGKFVKENWKDISKVIAAGGAINQITKNRKEEKTKSGKYHYRKMRYFQYQSEELPNLNNKTRKELLQCKIEIEQFIQQIETEENKGLAIKKPVHSKRINNWNNILIQIEDKMSAKDYQELLLIYNDPNYRSKYYEGFEKFISNTKKIIEQGDMEELYTYLQAKTNKDRTAIEKDFQI
ncbi:hypothetical protein [Cytobacillus firmus]|uniref:hypothetical protein n=1 Tax=Cytobacillus firmus TaxID=1399 RepID=UPI002228207B|nr:hypothetical protein [Cytobacillus firmus]